MQHIQWYNCNKTGHKARECPKKKIKDPSGGSSGEFAMMCIEILDPQELNSKENSETQTEEEIWTLQDWIDQSHKNEIQHEQEYITERRCQNDQSRHEVPHQEGLLHQSGDIILTRNQNNEDKNNDEDNDCKLSMQEKKQAKEKKKAEEEDQSNYTLEMDNPPKKKR